MSDGGGDTGGDFGGNDGGGGSWEGNNDHHHNHDTYHDNHHYGNHHDSWDNDYYGESSNSRGGCIALAIMIFGSIFFAVGAGAGGLLLSSAIEKVNSWESVIGTIIDTESCPCTSTGGNKPGISSNRPTNCSPSYAPVVEYDVDGTTYQFTSNSCSSPGPTVGSDIKVLYDPENPGEAVSGTFVDLYLAPIILAIFAIVGLGVCVAGIMMRKRHSNNENTFDGNNMALGQVGAETAYPSKPPMMQQTGWNQEPAKPTPSSTVQSAPPAVEESTPTNPYALHAQQQSQNTSTNNGGNSNGAKPSLFDQLNGKV